MQKLKRKYSQLLFNFIKNLLFLNIDKNKNTQTTQTNKHTHKLDMHTKKKIILKKIKNK